MADRFLRAAGALITLLALLAPARAEHPVTVFAAASLGDVLDAVGHAYDAQGGVQVVFSFASSSALARQIEASGGADIFISADRDWMDELGKRGLLAPGTRRNLAGNRLVLVAPAASNVAVKVAPHFDLQAALHGGRLALADPDSVPAGKYARAALTTLGVWDSVAPHLAPAENVRAALAYVARGEAPLGIVYATDAQAEPRVKIVATFPDRTHPPIVYPAALLTGAKPRAKAFLAFLTGARARAMFARAGFLTPASAAVPATTR
jgi:molybdate transport system substrate-binding protein